jgi:DMSO/TMAO reductase YedYZ molybdopterin-dependent catalytic subunit
MPPCERREALPAHLVPAGLTAVDTWRLRVDGLVAQPLALSVSGVEACEARARADAPPSR